MKQQPLSTRASLTDSAIDIHALNSHVDIVYMLSPGPGKDQQVCSKHYHHDVTELEIDFLFQCLLNTERDDTTMLSILNLKAGITQHHYIARSICSVD